MAVHTTDHELLSPTAAERARFASKVAVSDTGCWLWTGSLFTAGYGAFKLRGQNRRAHRVLWVWEFGPVPEGLLLDHLCHPADCVGGPQRPHGAAATGPRPGVLRATQEVAALRDCGQVLGVHTPPVETCKTCHREREAARRAASRR